MSVVLAGTSGSHIPQRRTHREVIDVDELEDEQLQPQPRRQRLPRSSSGDQVSEIIVLDSDDEVEPGPSTRPRPIGGRLRSPPPPVRSTRVPPVPPLPPRLRARRPPAAFPTDVIRPNPEPMEFERAMAAHVTRPASHPPLAAAPPSHHLPVMALGGGFISLTPQSEARVARNRQTQALARQRYFDHLRVSRGIQHRHGFLSQAIGRIFPTWLFGDPTEEERMDALAFSEVGAQDGLHVGGEALMMPHRRVPHEYRVAYTHPYPSAPGFTHDFESPSPSDNVIDVDAEPSTSSNAAGSSSAPNENMNTLACARCLDPLVLAGSRMSDEERTHRRLWSLLCGHILDGKCITELMKPQPAPGLEPPCTDESPDDQSQCRDSVAVAQAQPTPRTPGTDARNSPDLSTSTAQPNEKAHTLEPLLEPAHPADTPTGAASFGEYNCMRSRLRPRNTAGHVAYPSAPSSLPLQTPSQPQSPRRGAPPVPPVAPAPSPPVAISQAKRRSKGKGKQKAVVPSIIERHEWHCPVSHCDRLHISLHIEGQGWTMDETQGAIPIFA
ncbi:hypothetical protein BC834DRAFT_845722 [Gloeopeniophorella convolvens]|nr:hypothetical protein BC834DRAFT_845722 [Gloeopeniophorella convolvens]